MKMFEGLWDSIKDAWIGIRDRFSSLKLGEALGTLATADDGAAMEQGGRAMMSKFWEGLKSIGEKLLNWASSFAGNLKSLLSFSISPTLSLPNGAPLVLQPQSYSGGGDKLTPAPGLQRQASMTFHNQFNINGSDNPDTVAKRIVAALDRQRQSGLYDGALA